MTLILGVAVALLANGSHSQYGALFANMEECAVANTEIIQTFVRTPTVTGYFTDCFAVTVTRNTVPPASEATR